MNVKIMVRALCYYYHSFRTAPSQNGMDTRLTILRSASPVNGSSWCTNDTWFTSPKSQVCFHYFTLLTIVFLPLCHGRGTAVAIHFASFFFNDGGHVMINVLFLLSLFVYAEGKAHGGESTAFLCSGSPQSTDGRVRGLAIRPENFRGRPINANGQVIHVMIHVFFILFLFVYAAL